MDEKTITVLAVALITWAGVFAYLIRVHLLTMALQKKMDSLDETASRRAQSGE